MLVLTRRAGESIVIGDDVRVVVLDVRGEIIRLGIEAPRSVQVHRAEVYAEVQAANRASALAAAAEDLDGNPTSSRGMAKPTPPRPRPPHPERLRSAQPLAAEVSTDQASLEGIPAQVALNAEVPSDV